MPSLENAPQPLTHVIPLEVYDDGDGAKFTARRMTDCHLVESRRNCELFLWRVY